MKETKKEEKKEAKSKFLAVVRVRGSINLNEGVEATFKLLNLSNKNWCVILSDSPSSRGMIQKVKDYVTWGEISEETLKEMLKNRAEPFVSREKDSKETFEYKKYFAYAGKKYKKQIRLAPPKKGYGRNGVKTPFVKGGALGYRAEKINDLISRMM